MDNYPTKDRVMHEQSVTCSKLRERESPGHLLAKSRGSGKDPKLSRFVGYAQIAAIIWSEKSLG
jgi:hypothetical protein